METEKSVKVYNNDELKSEQDSSFQRMSGILTDEEIARYKLVHYEKNTPQNSLKPTTFDLTLGEGHYVYNGEGKTEETKWKLVFIGSVKRMQCLNDKSTQIEKYTWQSGVQSDTLQIPAYGAALIQLNETVDTYTVAETERVLVVGRFDLKLESVHKGIISQQATQVEPYYRGKLFCFIHNLSNKDIRLRYGEKIATIEFSYVSCFGEEQDRKKLIKKLKDMSADKYNNEDLKLFCLEDNGTAKGIAEVRYFRAMGRLPNDCGLLGLKDRILEEVKEDKIVEQLVKSDLFMEKLVEKIGKKLQK